MSPSARRAQLREHRRGTTIHPAPDVLASAQAAGLRYVNDSSPGFTRRRKGKRTFAYFNAEGGPLTDADVVARIRSLAIPPAWQDVWICPVPNGHLQATGTDAAGRRQYLYHPDWRTRRDRSKFDRVVTAAAHLPQARRQVAEDLALDGMPLERAAAAAVACGA